MAKKYRNFDIGIEFSIGGVVSEIRPVHMLWNGALCETALAREEVMRLIVPGKPRRPPQKPLFCTPPVRRKRECTGIEPAAPAFTPAPPILKTGNKLLTRAEPSTPVIKLPTEVSISSQPIITGRIGFLGPHLDHQSVFFSTKKATHSCSEPTFWVKP